MNKRLQKSTSVVNIGFSSLLVIFLILCLVVFAILSLASSSSSYNYSKRIADRNTAYYAAVSKAEQIWDELDNAVMESGNAFAETEINYTVPIDDSQQLSVTLLLKGNEENGFYYGISQWKTVNTADWKSDNSMDLLSID